MDEQENFLFPWRIRLVLKRQKLFYHTLSCLDIAQKIESAYRDLYTVASPDNIGIIDIYIDFSQMKLKKKEEEEIVNINHKEDICIRNIIIPFLQDILIAGIPDVEDVYIHEEKGKWVIDTQGSNLSEIFKNPNFDFRHCLSSDIWEIKKILGIEATRQFIINEFYKVLNQSGASIGRRHIELLADSMTFQGKISSVNRYGIDRNETGPLAKAIVEPEATCRVPSIRAWSMAYGGKMVSAVMVCADMM
jgi:DNA-directed RNA polymerase beta' subunit